MNDVFSVDYNLGTQTNSDRPEAVIPQQNVSEYKDIINTEYYALSKPKRIIIKARIINE